MPLGDMLKSILGFAPKTAGELNRKAAHEVKPVARPSMRPQTPEGIQVTPAYRQALELIDAGAPLTFVTGKAGTGKSTFIQYLRGSGKKKRLVVLAPTGVAALNVQGATIHSFFRLPPHVLSKDDVKRVQDRSVYRNLDLVILDEISMVRADVLDAIDAFLRLNGREAAQPFGGTQVLMVGDLQQLPPVLTTTDESAAFSRRYSTPYFFSAHSIEHEVIAPVELDRTFRQSDPEFIDALNRVRLGRATEDVLRYLNARVMEPPGGLHPITLTPTNAAADRINFEEMAQLAGEVRTYIGDITGELKIEEEKLPAPLQLTLKVGARVMFTKNDSLKRWVNGSLGIVRELKPEVVVVGIEESNHGVVTVERATWGKYKYEYDENSDEIRPKMTASYSQIPLTPAWAITIHKSQGKTLPAVRLDLGSGAFAPGQTYVALSRARSLESIWLSRAIRAEDVIVDPKIIAFYEGLFGGTVDGRGANGAEDDKYHGSQTGTEGADMAVASKLSDSPGTRSQSVEQIKEFIEEAMESGDSIVIIYRDAQGNESRRSIRPRVWVNGDRFTAFCDLRSAERDFRVSRITSCEAST